MNRRLFLPLMICGLILTGCYRQASDSFEQVDSQSVESIASPTMNVPVSPTEAESDAQSASGTPATSTSPVQPSKTPDPADVEPTDVPLVTSTLEIPAATDSIVVPTATSPVFLTPEPPPGQVEQPTIIPPTATPLTELIPPTSTSVSDGPQAGDECIHEVVAGDTLFRISVNNGTTVEALQELNGLEGSAIQVGQLLRIPGCVPGQPDEDTETVAQPTATSSTGGSRVATVEPAGDVPVSGQQIHVVVSGETLGAIANRYGVSINSIIEINNLTNPDALSVGQELVIPPGN